MPPNTPNPDKLAKRPYGWLGRLSTKLLMLTIAFVMVNEIFVFVPSIAKFRNDWLEDRLTRALTILILMPDTPVDEPLERKEIERIEKALKQIDAITLARRKDGRKQLIAMMENDFKVAARLDFNQSNPFRAIGDAFGTLLAQEPRTILVSGVPSNSNQYIELVVLEAPLRKAMLQYTWNIIILSLLISGLTAAMVYFTLTYLFVRPIKNMADNMVAFSQNPEASDRVVVPSGRLDELGIAEERLAAMQSDLQTMLSSQKHLANLGLAMSKVNHDLRNILASVQLFTDRLSSVNDPNVRRFAPKLISGIDRAISYCQATLVYGSAREEPPKRQLVNLHAIGEEVASLLNLAEHETIEWHNLVPESMEIEVDPEQVFRVLMNLSRNAIKAMEAMEGKALVRRLELKAAALDDRTRIVLSDSGPGLPERAKLHLFEAFRGSVSKGGVGLGLAIASEIVRAHGGTIKLLEDGRPGATFEIDIPHRDISLTD